MERKTKRVIESLRNGPMKLSAAVKIAGNEQLAKLESAGCVVKYANENPDYHAGARGQKPMCAWVKLGSVEYVEPRMGCSDKKIAGPKGIAAAIRVLERAGYTVLPPNAIAQGREHSERPAGAEG